MLRYIFNSKEDVLVGVQLAELQSHTRNVGKKDGIRLYLKQEDPNLYVQILSANKGSRGNISFVKTGIVDFLRLNLPEFVRKNDEPNTVAIISDFAKTCKIMSSIKCDYVYFQGFPKGVKVSAYLEGQLVGKAEKFGDCDNFPTGGSKYPDIRSVIESISLDVDKNLQTGPPGKKLKLIVRPGDDVPTIRVPSDIISHLSKTNNISQNGIVRMYFEEKKPARFLLPIGYYGKLTVLIRDQSIPLEAPSE